MKCQITILSGNQSFVIESFSQLRIRRKKGQSEKKGFKWVDHRSTQFTQLSVDTPYLPEEPARFKTKNIKHFRISKKKSRFFLWARGGRTTFDRTGYQSLLSPLIPPQGVFSLLFSFYIFQDSSTRGPKNEKKIISFMLVSFFSQ